MAFEAFLTQDQAKPTGRRRLTYTLSLLAHGAVVLVGVVYSFWHVEELSPPTVRVTFLSAMPPPPPPPPPGGNGGARKKVTSKPKPTVTPTLVQPKATLVQPKEKPEPETKKDPPKTEPKKTDDDEDDALPGGVVGGTKGGVAGGTIGGTVGGVVGGTIDATPTAAKVLPPMMGKKQKVSGDEPVFPVALRKAGVVHVVMAKICVSKTGALDGVTIMKKADPELDANVISAVKTWRHNPLLANNTPVPFCYFERFEFKAD
jgi:protein TonB